ncbi:MAG: hypothetical protein AAFR83_15635 [Cyanobacteria bacterium J06629_18]
MQEDNYIIVPSKEDIHEAFTVKVGDIEFYADSIEEAHEIAIEYLINFQNLALKQSQEYSKKNN